MITQTKARDGAIRSPRSSGIVGTLRPFLVPILVTTLVVVAAVFGPSALSNPVSGAAPAGARLEVEAGYLAFAPVFNVLDTLSVLTLGQHYAVLVTLIGIFAAWRIFRRRDRRGWLVRTGIELGVAIGALAGLLAFYGFGMIGHRPMAALRVTDPDVLILDVHSHTGHSHDGRDSFDAEANREWHAAAGFHAAYVSDHRTWRGFSDAERGNPTRAGEWTTLLPALEIKFAGKYANAFGPAWRYRHAAEGNHLIADSLYRSLRDGGPTPTLMLTIPGGLDEIPSHSADSIGYVAIEVSDAAPRGLRQSRRDRSTILRMADSLDLALVAGSNNHGWGRTAAAWTLLRIPGWRHMSPGDLSAAIERKLHRDRRAATWVVERRMPWAGESPAALLATVPAITWQMFGGLGLGERVSWVFWAWAAALVFLLVPGFRRVSEIEPVSLPVPDRQTRAPRPREPAGSGV